MNPTPTYRAGDEIDLRVKLVAGRNGSPCVDLQAGPLTPIDQIPPNLIVAHKRAPRPIAVGDRVRHAIGIVGTVKTIEDTYTARVNVDGQGMLRLLIPSLTRIEGPQP